MILRRLIFALVLTTLVGAAAPAPRARLPSGPDLCRASHATLFACRMRSGEWVSLCLRRAGSGWKLTFIDPHNGRRSPLTDVAMWNGGFAHGGEAVLEGQARHVSVAFFVVAGGIPDQTGAMMRETRRDGSSTRICRDDSVRLPPTFAAGPNAPRSLFFLRDAGLAREIPDRPDWPDAR